MIYVAKSKFNVLIIIINSFKSVTQYVSIYVKVLRADKNYKQ